MRRQVHLFPANRRLNFNPRSREGSDSKCNRVMERTGISIHAPAKGATHCFLASTPFYSFQSTLPQRERLRGAGLRIYNLTFQSTLPRRERHQTVMALFTSFPDFNPRSREGSDGILICRCLGIIYFNPRSREGSDIACKYFDAGVGISIHAPAKGATPYTIRNAVTS